MDDKKIFTKYRRRIVKEGVLKSLFLGVICGTVALDIVAFVTWLVGYKPGLFIALGGLVLVTAAVTPLLYFLRYRPTVKQVARRIDELGLEERVITMTELEGEDSFMARAQREDTLRAVKGVDHMLLKLAISVAFVLPFVCASVLGMGMTTVSALHYAGVIPGGISAITGEYLPQEFTVSYAVEEECKGSIIWWKNDWTDTVSAEVTQTVTEGEDLSPVYAIPADGWYFVSWSDGVMDPYRHDTDIRGDIIVTAIFEEGEPDPEEGEQNQSQNQQQQDTGEPNESESNSSSSQENNDSPEGEPNDDPSAGGMRDTASQQIVDGQTYYGDEFEDAYRDAMERLAQDNNIPEELKKFVADYFKAIETGKAPEQEGEQLP